ncbi:MAG: LD-carboxypeptidase [Bacteroidia bacterium]|nr:LD-carboxypeptidase [Bacteroidia bacterium]
MNRYPSPLKSGDKIAIVASARKVRAEEIQPAFKVLESWGFSPVYGKNLFKEKNQFAGTDEERLADLQEALNDDSVRAILFARGGYGSVRIVDGINWTNFNKNPKWLIGFSDITVFHSHVHSHHNICTLHGPMGITFQNDESNYLESVQSVLLGNPVSFQLESNHKNKAGKATAQLVGGNLSMLYSLLGSPSDINTNGKILFIEDLDEYLYHIDRMMMNLKRNGKLNKLSGLIVGGISDMRDNEIKFGKTAEQIILEHVEEFDYPIAFDFEAGHIKRNNALILGDEVTLEVADKTTLTFSYGRA